MSEPNFVAMRVAAVVVDPETKSPVLILRVIEDSAVYLPIFIGHLEATAIAAFLANMEVGRPMTHDLFVNVMAKTGWTLEQIAVTKIVDNTFFAELTLRSSDGQVEVVDARPSDSVALALRSGARIAVAQEVLEQAGGRQPQEPEESEGSPESEMDEEETARPVLDANTDLESVDPELFGKYKM